MELYSKTSIKTNTAYVRTRKLQALLQESPRNNSRSLLLVGREREWNPRVKRAQQFGHLLPLDQRSVLNVCAFKRGLDGTVGHQGTKRNTSQISLQL